MTTRDDDKDEGRVVVWATVIGVSALAICLAVGMALGRMYSQDAATASQPQPQPHSHASAPMNESPGESARDSAAATEAPAPEGDGPSVSVAEGVVKFYFATGKADLAEGAKEALADIVRGVAAGKTAAISGYHDATGNAAFNAELAKKRALSVKAALLELGVGEEKITLHKPEAAEADTSGGSNAQARRVEVRLD